MRGWCLVSIHYHYLLLSVLQITKLKRTSFVFLAGRVHLFLCQKRCQAEVGEFDAEAVVNQAGGTVEASVMTNGTSVKVIQTLATKVTLVPRTGVSTS